MVSLIVLLMQRRGGYAVGKSFEETKVFEMVKGLNGDKTPSLDGFSLAFF
jgi:hypothetical protein